MPWEWIAGGIALLIGSGVRSEIRYPGSDLRWENLNGNGYPLVNLLWPVELGLYIALAIPIRMGVSFVRAGRQARHLRRLPTARLLGSREDGEE